jgi:hypothetical protein
LQRKAPLKALKIAMKSSFKSSVNLQRKAPFKAQKIAMKSSFKSSVNLQRKASLKALNIPNKHFGTKVRTMVRFFVPLWSQSSQQKAFPTENFSKSKK